MRYAPIDIVVNGNMASAITSETVPLDQVFGLSVQAVYTTGGTLGGVLSLEGSNTHSEDNEKNILNAGTWTTISSVTLSGGGNTLWNVENSNYLWLRVTYAPAGGDAGTLNVVCVTKGV